MRHVEVRILDLENRMMICLFVVKDLFIFFKAQRNWYYLKYLRILNFFNVKGIFEIF